MSLNFQTVEVDQSERTSGLKGMPKFCHSQREDNSCIKLEIRDGYFVRNEILGVNLSTFSNENLTIIEENTTNLIKSKHRCSCFC